ncbi:Late embryogenesis abundant protein [Melia azedarach]|uniref:Late embryogenesis abundant protein n=1 Tax=Melia azedarach TaxID=155640 RepID=A0ACC1XVT8_MELAZ|nr:Late embryogenesis abundant protein [Melia azedarach]
MNNAIRSFRANSPTAFLSPLPSTLGQKVSSVKLRQVTTLANKPENPQNMDSSKKMDPNNPKEKNEDVMSDSFGEGYATRSDEEGFGGIYGGNQSIPSVEIDKQIHENHPAYDKTQGSEVKEKEKGRHQTNATN